VDEAIQYGLIDKVLPPPRTVQQELAESLAAKSSYPKSWA